MFHTIIIYLFVIWSSLWSYVTPTKPLLLDYTIFFKDSWEASGMGLPFTPNNTPEDIVFGHEAPLNSEGTVKLGWNFDEENITFKVSAPTLGWLAVGIVGDEGNIEADIAVVWSKDGFTFTADMHSVLGNLNNMETNETQNLRGMFSWEKANETFLIFSRPLITCDDNDVNIKEGTQKILWAYGAVDPNDTLPLKGELIPVITGTRRLKLLNPVSPALNESQLSPDVKTLDVLVSPDITPGKLMHRCVAVNLPPNVHLIQFEPLLLPQSEFNVHQLIIRECDGKYLSFHNETGNFLCSKYNIYENCKKIIVAWATGLSTFAFPVGVGYPTTVSPNSFVLEVHYSKVLPVANPGGLRIFYTPYTPEYNSGIITLNTVGGNDLMIPPSSKDFVFRRYCTQHCLSQGLSNKKIRVFAGLLKADERGWKIKIRHFRDGDELKPLLQDDEFSARDIAIQFVWKEVEIQDGDSLVVECVYDNKMMGYKVDMGNANGEEHCLAYLHYYPRIDFQSCGSMPDEKGVMKFLNARSSKEIKKMAEKIFWTTDKKREYNDVILNGDITVQCNGSVMKSSQKVPEIKSLYVAPEHCEKSSAMSSTISYVLLLFFTLGFHLVHVTC